jgi:hypothetical protein
MADKKHWMQKAFAHNKGSFTKEAKAAGKGVQEFAEEKKDAGGREGKRANLALTAKRIASEKKRYG